LKNLTGLCSLSPEAEFEFDDRFDDALHAFIHVIPYSESLKAEIGILSALSLSLSLVLTVSFLLKSKLGTHDWKKKYRLEP
jgi:hypothetical protein